MRTCLYLYEEKTGTLKKLTAKNFDTASVCVSDEALLILGKEWENLIDQTDSVLLYDIKEKKLTKSDDIKRCFCRWKDCDYGN